MLHRRKAFVLVLCLLAGGISSVSALTRLEGVIAVVGDSAIVSSELDAYTTMRLGKMETAPDSSKLDSLRKVFLNELIDGKVLIVKAEKDTTISVSNADVEDAVSRQMSGILKENNLTLEQLSEEIAKNQPGMTLALFKSQMRKGLREQLLKQKMMQKYAMLGSISRKEVELFYTTYKDSLPKAGKSVRLGKLQITVSPTQATREAAYQKIAAIRQRIDKGEKFIDLAKHYSEDPNAAEGGDLGFVGKGTLGELTFEQKAFALEVGTVSDVFETRMGFHFITVEEKKGDKVHVRQVYCAVAPSAQSLAVVQARLDSVRVSAKTAADFEKAVALLSTDNALKATKGDLGWISLFALPEALQQMVDTLSIGGITPIAAENTTFAVFRINDRNEDRPFTLIDDYDKLAEKAKDIATQKKLQSLVTKWRAEVYVDIRL